MGRIFELGNQLESLLKLANIGGPRSGGRRLHMNELAKFSTEICYRMKTKSLGKVPQ
jgi:hypothetical protein